ncbi:MAG: hypothetical protein FJ206_11830 [Gemmatimonadetes bacterium]|nr:hypothetical protein [Gemmatimonadota bacterium]
MTGQSALDRVERYFARKATRAGWLARRRLGKADDGDETLRQTLIAAVAGSLRPDGSVGGTASATIGAIDDLLDLDPPPELLVAPLDWLMGLVGKPGAYHEGCSSARHGHRVCEHFLGGFFSPAPATQRVAPITVPDGKTYRVESQARFAVSVAALRAALRGGRGDSPAIARHLDSFKHLLDEWQRPDEHLPFDLLFGAMAAVAVAPSRWQPLLDRLVDLAAGFQLSDGTWQRGDFFHALAGLVEVRRPGATAVLRRAAPALLQRQRDDGSFGSVARDERALIGLRVLLVVGD